MTPDERAQLIACLQNLDGPDDPAVLTAARTAVALVNDLGGNWNDLLVLPETADDAAAEAAPDDTPIAAADFTEDVALIDALLARPNLFEGTRDELLGYKEDIAEGEFNAQDRRYLQALSQRLKG